MYFETQLDKHWNEMHENKGKIIFFIPIFFTIQLRF